MSTPTQPTAKETQLLQNLQRFPNTFKQITEEGNQLTTKIIVTGYSGLTFLITDILKAALLSLEADLPPTSPEMPNIATLIDLAVQLMPMHEPELLDMLHQHHIENKKLDN